MSQLRAALFKQFSNKISGRVLYSTKTLEAGTPRVPPVTARSSISKDPSEASITVLDNGILVVTDEIPGHFSAFGVYIDAGSRYETPEFAGVSHTLDRVAFKSTENMSAEAIKNQVEEFGGNLMSHSSREIIQYQGTVYNSDLEKIVPLFAEITQRPLFLQNELDEQKESTGYEIINIMGNPDTFLPEKLHTVAYKDKTLGKPFLCSPDRLGYMKTDLLMEYLRKMYVPERMVIAASGASHERVVELSQKYFGDMKSVIKDAPNTSSSESRFLSSLTDKIFSKPAIFNPDFSCSNYVGGIHFEEAPEAEFSQIYVALKGVGITEEDLYPLATLQALLGGGHSFSAGGPGKGIHSRLYRTVLNRYGWSNSCQAFNHSYRDSGLFGISGSCPPSFSLDMLHVIGYSLASVCDASSISSKELIRAKNQLKNNLLMNLESRLTRLEDMGQQVLVTGQRVSAATVCERIERLTTKDLADVAQKLIKTPPTILGYGSNLKSIERAQDILSKFGVGVSV